MLDAESLTERQALQVEPMPRVLIRLTLSFLLLIVVLLVLVYQMTWRPPAHELLAATCNPAVQAPKLVPGQALKVMTWNIQYLAGKRYVFWYDIADGSGPDDRPTPEDLAYNLDEVARVIRDEQPDIVLLQGVDDGAKNSDYQDQLKLLEERLIDLYPCSTQAFYWKAEFVPNPHIWGSVGRKLATLSRFHIDSAERLQLPVPDANLISRQFQPRNALLVSYLPLRDGGKLAVINTSLTTAKRDGAAQKQIAATETLLDKLEGGGTPWLIGGDFNLLPLGQYQRLPEPQRLGYAADSELHKLWEKYPMIPSNAESSGIDRSKWLTRFPNDSRINGPDRTVDYLFYSPALKRVSARVRRDDTLLISDHLPVIGRFLLPVLP
ncbi:endonuclease/exonuclease/phosphatase family protein [Pseudomonas cannabina]|uniref:Endonuclease/exonuclease/phosphatase family protein n=3 Tax=Pseudomonas syringae group TaxID=136849 RepID=A0A8T8BWZ7_PSEYM|nr:MULTISPECIES: endonuclease/exonuclease/phosphatase family protein [Pseudomonas syringae group]KPB71926.1 Endonuclease/exonuclease/phosphatase [Pseudomonas syringae pv. maculicola]MBM0142351.1 endonuclease/exonuclease/phosphatase family protein [Pseudomonas cannabina pv. alisalensis]QHE95566.1 endonuclease/exonuclease/phosphatase family protein [Pseudomonas syringae pv. maculicola str. ES4326]QQN22756.1 endonuclease/exonuclease/phosphatase family protein [Pseudomonas cannabina pv. alisalensis